jgi:hypothetical protein
MKRSEAKTNLPGRKQIFRQRDQDVIGLKDESLEGKQLLVKVMENGRRLKSCSRTLDEARSLLQENQERLKSQSLPYRVVASPAVKSLMVL